MNGLFIGDGSERVTDEDAIVFYSKISEVVGASLDPTRDKLTVKVPPWNSRNSANYARVCDLDAERRVCLKRCSDSAEFLRREALIPLVKQVLGFPNYKIAQSHGILLRVAATGRNCALLAGWEDKDTLFVDYGNPKVSESMATLQFGSIADPAKFCYSYGRWCAFDYLFGVRDRNAGNFVYFKDTGVLHSVDSEEGPFSSDGRFIGVEDILIQTKQNIERLINGTKKDELLGQLRLGFIEAYHSIGEKTSQFGMLNEKEQGLLIMLLKSDPLKLSEIYR
ncbi:MAG: hypothetical protein JRM77_06550 [Nitrososphaerota archaeon]|jgi:hypothetical protein|nr:hypothetical protein [Nitrososphaerota archaeon]